MQTSERPWCREEGFNYEADEITHVYPLFGPEHEMSLSCWCHPSVDDECDNLVIHNVQN